MSTPDLDGDGFLDLLAVYASYDYMVWYRHEDGAGTFGNGRFFGVGDAPLVNLVIAVDVDQDGDLDAVSSSLGDDAIVWYENTDGAGTFTSPPRVVMASVQGVRSLAIADLDGDGRSDLLAASKGGDWFGWFENLDPPAAFSPLRVIQGAPSGGAWEIQAGDLDGDGDLDVLGSSILSEQVGWFENMNGLGSFGARRTIGDDAGDVRSIWAEDVDGDGNVDVVVGAKDSSRVSWYRNLDGLGNFDEEVVLADDVPEVHEVTVADLDGDGDRDVIAVAWEGNYYGDDWSEIMWFRNGPYARATDRNAGPNPSSYSAVTLPVLGDTYTGQVDLAMTGHGLAMLAAFARPATFMLGGNMVLVDIAHPAGELLGFPIENGPVATFDFGIPPDPVFSGMEVFTPAVHVGAVFPYVLSNAQDLYIGY